MLRRPWQECHEEIHDEQQDHDGQIEPYTTEIERRNQSPQQLHRRIRDREDRLENDDHEAGRFHSRAKVLMNSTMIRPISRSQKMNSRNHSTSKTATCHNARR